MDAEANVSKKIALACKLTDRAQIDRMQFLHRTLFRKVDKTVDHADCYELIFRKPDSSLPLQLIEFIRFEQLCCPWLRFQLTFAPEEGPISLRLGDSAETKEMARSVMELNKPEPTRP